MTKKKLIKIIVAFACVLLLGILYLVDFAVSKSYEWRVIATSADEIVADGVSSVKIRVELSKNGEPIEGHTVYIYASNGSLPSSRCVTDDRGYITFTYYPYLYINDKVSPLEDVTFYFQDESNSFVFMVPASGEFTMKAVKPAESGTIKDWQDTTADDQGGDSQ